MCKYLFIILTLISSKAWGQTVIKGKVLSNSEVIVGATVTLNKIGIFTNDEGKFELKIQEIGKQILNVSMVGYETYEAEILIKEIKDVYLEIDLKPISNLLEDVVISGTMKEVSRLDSPVPVEVFTANFFKSNPTPSVFDALQNINGVKPQINCSVCNTGDIHINGLEGPYTMVLIDGMPIVSGLSTVYGLSGIPQSLIERMEVVKGPASTLYGSEAVGGLINVITKVPLKAPVFAVDVFGTSWGELSTDVSGKVKISDKVQSLLGVNYFNYQNPIDNNNDNFTDLTQQHRVSVFNKWDFDNRLSVAGRYLYEDRWGGEMNWNSKYRGGDEVYGESIYTKRWEFFGNYKLNSNFNFMFSGNWHDQNSVYGNVPFSAKQNIYFGQLTYGNSFGKHDVLSGLAYRYTFYDDNTPATFVNGRNKVNHTHLPGFFVQDEIKLNSNHSLMIGARFDHNSIHGSIFSPRVNYKWSSEDKNTIFRLGAGNGFRVANVFTEDHAALTGSREVVFLEHLNPETSWNINTNLIRKFYLANGNFLNLDGSIFYTYFNNKIIPDYTTDPNKIIYANLDGNAISKGISLNIDLALTNGLKVLAGGTLMEVFTSENGIKEQQMFTEKFTGTWTIGYTFNRSKISIDYTGNVFGPMRLPVLSELDPRPDRSPWWSIQNIQVSKKFSDLWEIYGGVKNLLNWTPNKSAPFLIARAHDPFDKGVEFGQNGAVIATPSNPYALTFDPTYMYASNQGIRGFFGLRFTLK